jgi:hypothetical protein
MARLTEFHSQQPAGCVSAQARPIVWPRPYGVCASACVCWWLKRAARRGQAEPMASAPWPGVLTPVRSPVCAITNACTSLAWCSRAQAERSPSTVRKGWNEVRWGDTTVSTEVSMMACSLTCERARRGWVRKNKVLARRWCAQAWPRKAGPWRLGCVRV